ncbi:MAG: bifunctional diguanylate cyclase/phosphodiesterase [Micavibrio sp.]|nr:MAG: bifunctional diguanylate cyclase/phosphodiesterase [Micavibrio sp.]
MSDQQKNKKSRRNNRQNNKDNQRSDVQNFFSRMGEAAYHWDMASDSLSWISRTGRNFTLPENITDQAGLQKRVNPQDSAERQAVLHELSGAADGEKREIFYRLQLEDGQVAALRETVTVTRDEDGGCYIYGRIEEQQKDATFEKDNLTGLYMRQWFLAQLLRGATGGEADDDREGHVLAVGIDRLAMYNEAFGARVTDELIRAVAERLSGFFKKRGPVARVSGDIFGISLPGENAEKISSLVMQLLSSFRNQPVETSEGTVYVTVSVGGIFYKGGAEIERPRDLMVKAESALQEAKRGGRGRYMSYAVNDKQREQFRSWLKTSDTLLTALGGNRLLLAFQPIICAKSNAVKFYETLVRMVDEEGRLIAAAEFMPVVEKIGTARLVDQLISKMALEELKAYPDLCLSINISAWTLEEPTWLRTLLRELQAAPDIAERLIVEITETIALRDIQRACSFVRTLQALGVRVALDDFGSGHTSFKQIKELGVDIVKIDKSFVRRMAATPDNRVFVQALQKLAEGCRVETVGEGAETMQEVEMLQKDGITYIQGYAFGFPSVERLWLEQEDAGRLPENARALQCGNKGKEKPLPRELVTVNP